MSNLEARISDDISYLRGRYEAWWKNAMKARRTLLDVQVERDLARADVIRLKGILAEARAVIMALLARETNLLWEPAPDCKIVHPYGEDGWRPGTDGGHEHLK